MSSSAERVVSEVEDHQTAQTPCLPGRPRGCGLGTRWPGATVVTGGTRFWHDDGATEYVCGRGHGVVQERHHLGSEDGGRRVVEFQGCFMGSLSPSLRAV